MGLNEDVPMAIEGSEPNYTTKMKILLEKMEQTEKINNAEIERVRYDMKEIMSLMQGTIMRQNQNLNPTQDTLKWNLTSVIQCENIKDNN